MIIHVQLIYGVKHDGRHKAGLVADEYFANVSDNSVCFNDLSLCGLHILLSMVEKKYGKQMLEKYSWKHYFLNGMHQS